MLHLLDTSTISGVMANHAALQHRLSTLSSADLVGYPVIAGGEILFGIERLPAGKRRAELQSKADMVLASFSSHPVPLAAAAHYSQIKADCERKGTPVDENDLWIAATALAMNAKLITSDGDFQRILGLTVENWMT